MVSDEGIEYILDVAFVDQAKLSPLYVGLIDASGYTGISASDTLSSHTGWTELTDYDEVARPELDFGNPSGGIINNPAASEFTPNASGSVVGYFITDDDTKGGTSGTMLVVDLFAEGTRTLQSGVIEALTVNITARNA